jgi:hypothetical protein
MDDWFQEPAPEPTKHDAYTRRLKAWGWLTPLSDGKFICTWEITTAQALMSIAVQSYVESATKMLNERVIFLDAGGVRYGRYGDAWWDNPEAPVS